MKIDHCHVRLEGLRGGHVFRHNDQVYIVIDKPIHGVCQGISKMTCLDVHNGQIREIDYTTGVEHYPDASIVLGAVKGWGSET